MASDIVTARRRRFLCAEVAHLAMDVQRCKQLRARYEDGKGKPGEWTLDIADMQARCEALLAGYERELVQ